MTPLDLARAFLEKGKEDEVLLGRLVDDTDVSDDIFGFHVQQAVEKFIKSVLAVEQARPTRTHDLASLFEQAAIAGSEIPEDILEVRSFTPYAVRNRNPFFDPAPMIDRKSTFALVQKVRAWAEEIVGIAG